MAYANMGKKSIYAKELNFRGIFFLNIINGVYKEKN